MRIFLRLQHRSIALVSNDYCITLRYVVQAKQCLIQYAPFAQTDLTGYQEITDRKYLGLVGIQSLKKDGLVFICVITKSSQVGSVRPNEDIFKVKDVEFYCLNSSEYDLMTKQRYNNENTWRTYDDEHPCAKLGKLLTTGFYYSRDFDLTNLLQQRGLNVHDYQQMFDSYHRKFLWNYLMIKEILKFRNRIVSNERSSFDRSEFVTFLIRGFVKSVSVKEDSLLTIISKTSFARLDDSFGASGVDENGYVANFVETEILYYSPSIYFSYAQTRGNVPLFYDIENVFLSNRKIVFTNSKELNEIAFDKHFDLLNLKSGNVVVLNCLKSKTIEEELNVRFKYFLKKKNIPSIDIDFSRDTLVKSPHKLSYLLKNSIIENGAFCYDVKKKVYIGKQLGIFRINSLSMNKSGLIEKIISKEVVELSLCELNRSITSDAFLAFKVKHDLLWDQNNEVIESIYEKSIKKTGKKIFSSMGDKVLLYDPFHDFTSNELKRRYKEYSSLSNISILAGTFNVNAETYEQDITNWVNPDNVGHDIIVIGLEEVVELTTTQMMVTDDDSKKKFWESKIKKTLNQNGLNYSLTWSNQLGGIVLLFYVRDDQIMYIKDVNGMVKKTGFGGISANKGGVALSFTYSSTRFCFIVSHFAAGLENVEQRQNDYKTISKTVRFRGDKRIKDHDAIIWMGDFNYRILLSNEEVRESIITKNYNYLFEFDQLNNQMIAGESFPYFNEMEIKFAPTYKFDKGTSNYDTSEKLRIPAWTDRILRRGSNLVQISYNSVPEIKFSDHRPIYATFKAEVLIINEELKHKLTKELYESRKQELDKKGINAIELQMLKNISSANNNNGGSLLPPPSTDKSKWWIEGGHQVKVNLDISQTVSMVNPLRPANPFVETSEPDFI